MRGLIALCAALTAIGPVVGPAPYEAPRKLADGGPALTAGHPVLPADGRNTEARRGLLPTEAERVHALRVRKCEKIVEALYPNSGFLPYCETLVSTHERMAIEHGQPGFAGAWFWSFVYGGANFSLQVGGIAPGSCAGPLDVKHYDEDDPEGDGSPLVLDPVANIEWHCREMLGFYKRGVRGRDLCEHVFYPAAPRDWQVRDGQGRFARTEQTMRDVLRND